MPYKLAPNESPYDEPKGKEFSVIVLNADFEIIGEYPYVGGAARCGVGGVGAGRRGAHLVDPRARGVPPRLAPGSRGRGLDHGFRVGFLPAGRRGPVAPRQCRRSERYDRIDP